MKKPADSKLPKVSFIIPTLNASHILPMCLLAIRGQHYPRHKVEIIIADGGSTDNTLLVANKYNAKVIKNPEVLHEHGKSRASRIARGDILFYTDADNILAHPNWLNLMVQPYLDNPNIMGFLPQTIAAPDSNSLDRYLGHLFTDPFTWFIYCPAANPLDYNLVYTPIKITKTYTLYQFPISNPPLFGLSQGVGTNKRFIRSGYADDLLAGIKLIEQGGLVAYVPQAGVYHYHVSGLGNFIKKYSWRIQNNLSQQVKGMGLVNRIQYFPIQKKVRMAFFIPYTITLIFPFFDSVRLVRKYRDWVMLWHTAVCVVMVMIIFWEYLKHFLRIESKLKKYE